jgi:hypothetical protein
MELARRFFPDVSQAGSKGDAQAFIETNTRACEVILLDFIKKHDEAFDAHGPGVLVVNLTLDADEQVGYVTLEGWEKDREEARRLKDPTFEEFFEKVIRMVRANEGRAGVLLLLIDRTSQRLLNIPRDMPAERIRDLQAQLAAGGGVLLFNRPRAAKPEGFGSRVAKEGK